MKTTLVLGLLATLVLAAPAASAHIIVHDLDDPCDAPSVVIPAPVHVWVGLSGCAFNHDDIPEELVLPLP